MMYLDFLDFIKNSDILSVTLARAELIKESFYCGATRYLSLTYEVDTVDAIYHITFPRLVLPIFTDKLPDIERGYCGVSYDVGYGHMTCKSEPLVKCVEKKPKKMTISEIEKALGTKVELIEEDGTARSDIFGGVKLHDGNIPEGLRDTLEETSKARNCTIEDIFYEKPSETLFSNVLKECQCHVRNKKHDCMESQDENITNSSTEVNKE